MSHSQVYELACQLIARASVTPEDAGCQDILAARLAPLGFDIEWIDRGDVRNLWAVHAGAGPHLMFAGHTDVVPTGPAEHWATPPFTPTVIDGHLYGRGAADMKASLAAMVVAAEQALATQSHLPGTLSLLITSDEEGDAIDGTRYAIEVLKARGVQPDFCVVGEPSSTAQLGDVVRCGRRGSLNGNLIVHGVQGHVAYPADAVNPIHEVLAALDELAHIEWDNGNEYYPPTSLQISNIHAGTGASNVVPGSLQAQFNLRFSTEQTSQGLQRAIEHLLDRHGLTYDITWRLSGDPFITPSGALTDAVSRAIEAESGRLPQLSTSGGTSDGRFIAPWGNPGASTVEVVELGPVNATIHKIDENVAVADLEPLARIYARIIAMMLLP